ncbi:hypothetical protein [Brevibacillus sp. 179-C 1.1 NHS]|uniref:hypothetical protein n=1 Tax=Brevibacillus sp. 179-C 1.1 NHS TaxID=3235177 RepID=UPI0039A0A2F2
MNQPKAFATFRKQRGVVYRTSTYIQWGSDCSAQPSLGSCLLLNPGAAKLSRERPAPNHTVMGQTTLDPTMQQLIRLTESIYEGRALTGRLHIYNLFSVQNTSSVDAIPRLEQLIEEGETTLASQLVSIQELQKHPWLLLGWGCLQRRSWRHFSSLKEMWNRQILAAGIPTFGKRCSNGMDYYHPCPRLHSMKAAVLRDLLVMYRQTIEKNSSAHA